MEVTSFICPECSTTLRIKNQSFIDRSFDCPECQTALKVTANAQNILQIQQDDPPLHPSLKKKKPRRPSSKEESATSSNSLGILLWLQTPLVMLAVAGVVVISVVVIAVWLISNPSVSTPSDESSPVVELEKKPIDPVENPIVPKVKPKPPPEKFIPPVIAKIPQHWEPAIAQIPDPEFPITQPPPKPKPIDIATKLKQRFAKFDQLKPITLQQFLFQFEELLGVPVVVDESTTNSNSLPLTQTVSFQLKDGTLLDLLDKALSKLNLTYKIEPTQLRIINKELPSKFNP